MRPFAYFSPCLAVAPLEHKSCPFRDPGANPSASIRETIYPDHGLLFLRWLAVF
jgi:hypothetical protein